MTMTFAFPISIQGDVEKNFPEIDPIQSHHKPPVRVMIASFLVLSDRASLFPSHRSFSRFSRYIRNRVYLRRLPALIESRYDIRVPYLDQQRAFAGNRGLRLTES